MTLDDLERPKCHSCRNKQNLRSPPEKFETRMRGKAQRDGRPAVKWMEAFTRDMGKVRM